MSTQPLGIRVICDAKRSASCRDYIETGALQIYNARIIARHEGWDTTPEVPRRDICPACMRGKQLLDQDVALVAMFERTDRIRCDIAEVISHAAPIDWDLSLERLDEDAADGLRHVARAIIERLRSQGRIEATR